MLIPTRLLSALAMAALILLPATLHADAGSESDRLNAFFQEVHEAEVARWPEWQTSLGLKRDNHLWNDRSEARRIEELEITIRDLARLRRDFDYDKLDPSAKLSYRLFERGSELHIAWFPFRHHGFPVNHLRGMHSYIPAFLANDHRVDDKADAEAYIARLEGVPRVMDQTIQRLTYRAERGIVPPAFVFPQVLDSIDAVLTGVPFEPEGEDTAILADFCAKIGALDLTEAEADDLMTRAERALREEVKPAYLRLRRTMASLAEQASGNDGAWSLPDGEAYYALTLYSQTTTDLTPDEIHDYGLAEVARIHDEMRDIIEDIGFEGDLQAFFAFLREDPSNFYPDSAAGRDAYLAHSRAHLEEMAAALDDYFDVRPKAALEVRRVEPYREATTNMAFYVSPAAYSDRPGIYYVNLYDMSLMPKTHLESLAYHEGLPGHHMQIAIAQELEGLPEFRKLGGNTAYIEGWALYAEKLAKEMGFFRDPLSDFGRLAWELLRAARLVVDTGLHHKRWSREEAIAYLDRNIPSTHDVNRKAIDRYIVWPAQATAYKIGMREIEELRRMAEDRLGAAFDIRDFHRVVLTNGSLPLALLREQVEAWVAAKEG